MAEFPSQIKQTTCPYCGVGCGIDVQVKCNNKSVSLDNLQGSMQHPANFGQLCVKGTHLLETTQEDGRLLHPQVLGKQQTWDEASSWVAQKLTETINTHGPDSVAFYVSGQLLTEDYYVANKLMKGFIGSANIDTNSRLCMSSAVAAYKRAFGEDLVPCCYEDLECTELLILIGSNAAWTHPVLFQRMERAKQTNPNMKIVHIDPRKNASTSLADIHLAIAPGTDAILFNGLLHYLVTHQHNESFVAQYTEGFEAAKQAANEYTLSMVAQACDINELALSRFYALFLHSKTALSFYSMGINQSSSGVDKANAIINCHLASGKIGKQGCGPFSITGQPNAMGGREVGGLANMLAAHMDIENAQHRELVSEFWQTDKLPKQGGLKAVDLFCAMNKGSIKFIWIMGTNPVVSMPNRGEIESALRKCDTVVVSEVVSNNDTLQFAHAALPASPWSEKEGTVTNSERRISRQRSLVSPKGEARHDWQIICDVANKMGFAKEFSFRSPAQIFKEHAKLSAYKNNGERAFNLLGLTDLSEYEYEQLTPVQWPITKQDLENGVPGQKRLFTNKQFFTASKKAQFIAIIPRLPEQATSELWPFVLNTGRLRDHWHTMTRTGNAARLHQHTEQANVYMHSNDAAKMSFKEDDLLELSSCHSASRKVILPLRIDNNLRPKSLFAPIHWSNEWSSHGSIAWLFSNSNDPISGQPELKHAAVNLSRVNVNEHAILACKHKIDAQLLKQNVEYWTQTKLDNCYVYKIASFTDKHNFLSSVQALMQTVESIVAFNNPQSIAQNTYAAYKSTDLEFLLHTSSETIVTSSEWLNYVFGETTINTELQHQLLHFSPAADFFEGKLICSCHKVKEAPIKQAIVDGATTVDELGKRLKCGTNCGSCKSELSGLIEACSQLNNEHVFSPLTKDTDHANNKQTIPCKIIEANTL